MTWLTADSDELPLGKTVEHLRSVLVDIGTLPPRDEQMTRLNHWIACVIGERPDPGQQHLLHRYAVWHVIRRLRGRLGATHATHGQVLAAQRIITAAVALLDWLTARDLTLAAARQGDLEAWLASAQASRRTDAGNFVRWARTHKLTSMDFAASKPPPWLFPGGQPGRPISAYQLAERLRQLGIHISVAAAWQRASAGGWMTYAADISRRSTTPAQPAAETRPTPT
ncbi:MAG: hypothetical protein ACREOE_21180 [Gemmatimonadales bacterium]